MPRFVSYRWAFVGALLCSGAVVRGLPRAQPQFRSGVDLVAVDVQVVRADGRPIPHLGADRFEVTIGGRARRVVSAQFLSYEDGATASAQSSRVAGGTPASSGPPRIFIVAIDCLSFNPAVSRGVVEAVRRFVAQLHAADLVGLFAFPQGPKLNPTTDRSALLGALDRVQGQRDPPVLGSSNLSASELVDFVADEQSRFDILMRQCGGARRGTAVTRAPEPGCAAQLTLDAYALVNFYEGQARTTLGMLGQLFGELTKLADRKTVVLVSGGMPVSDRPGGRPDVGDLPMTIGRLAARSNALLYTLHVDTAFLERFSAETRAARWSDASRDSAVSLRWLDAFSATAGGSLMRVLVGNGETSFLRIAQETSAYYLLGVAPEPSDRNGQWRELRVRVNERGATVRARRWVLMPPATSR